ncbi:MAG: alpha/beta hydrolase [Anaerolineae bacterium]|nr:alpha/beta hydrolase [Anaerolineae bacterium]
MPTKNLSNSTVFYLEHKAESVAYPPLVLIHGAGGSHHDWPEGLQQLPHAHVLTLDLPGHGNSPGPGRKDMLEYAQIVCKLLNALHIERVVIAGHSMGGAIAQQIEVNIPGRAAGMILVGTGSKFAVDPTLTQRIIEDHAAAVDWLTEWSWGVDIADGAKAAGRERLASVAPEVLQGDYLACRAFDGRPYLEQITAPTLVLGSDADRMVPLKFSITLAEQIPDARLVVIEDAGHNFPLERPAEVIDAIAAWLVEREWTA